MNKKIKIVSLFSGIGGFEEGIKNGGIGEHVLCELIKNNFKKQVNLITKEIKQIIEKYTKNRTLMCKTNAIDIYGKDYIATQNHYAETNNPYYKCASNRKLYNKDVLEYNYNNKE